MFLSQYVILFHHLALPVCALMELYILFPGIPNGKDPVVQIIFLHFRQHHLRSNHTSEGFRGRKFQLQMLLLYQISSRRHRFKHSIWELADPFNSTKAFPMTHLKLKFSIRFQDHDISIKHYQAYFNGIFPY